MKALASVLKSVLIGGLEVEGCRRLKWL